MDTTKSYQVLPWPAPHRRQPLHQFHRGERKWWCAVEPGCFQLEYHVAFAVDGKALVGDRRVRDVAAQMFDTLAIIGITAHPGIRAEAVGVGAVHIAQAARFVQWATLTQGPQEFQKGRNHNTVW